MRHMVTTIRALLVLLLIAAPAPLFAADYTDKAALDELFAQLKVAQTPQEANDLTAADLEHLVQPRCAGARRADEQGQPVDVCAAISRPRWRMLTSIVTDYPDYAEGWNQRATLYFIMGNLDASLADIEKVLALEPRHFGALSGRVMIYLKQGKRGDALKDMIAALGDRSLSR